MNRINILFIKRTDINLSVLIFFIKKGGYKYAIK